VFPTAVELFTPEAGVWQQAGALKGGRNDIAAAVDPRGGRVLFAGGFLPLQSIPTAEAELGNASGWVTSSLSVPRFGHAVAFALGKFVVSGGNAVDPTGGATMEASAEALDSASGMWEPAGTMPGGPRVWHTMTALADGHRILVAGGCLGSGSLRSADIFDVATTSWAKAADMNGGRCSHGAVLLSDGRVLVAGAVGTDVYLPDSEIYDPGTNTWTAVAPMLAARNDFAALILPDGRVLVAGGTNDAIDPEGGALNSVEIYDASANTWTMAPPLAHARQAPNAAVLADGIYVTGGFDRSGGIASTERLAFSSLPGWDAGTTDASDVVDAAENAVADTGHAPEDGGLEDTGAYGDTTLAVDAPGSDAAEADAQGQPHDATTASACGCRAASADRPIRLYPAVILAIATLLRTRRRVRAQTTSR
jgi:hypothetical protein